MILMSADIERITQGWQTIHDIWANVLEVAIAIYLLERQMGAACAVPIAVAIVSMAGSLAATNLVMSRQAMWLGAIEKRIAATTTMLSSMKGVKMCGLTDTMSNNVHKLRMEELKISRKFRKLLIWNMGFTYITPVAAPILTFAVFSVISRNSANGQTLDTARVFTSLSLFSLLSEPLQSLIMTMATFMGSVGSFQRIQQFLILDARIDARRIGDVQPISRQQTNNRPASDAPTECAEDSDNEKSLVGVSQDYPRLLDIHAFAIYDGSFGWDACKEPLLSDLNILLPRDNFTVLVGPVGCGKSTLLKALLGEVPSLTGHVQCCSSEIAFCDQTPWHMYGTVQESILGTSSLDEAWYSTVIQACALDEDLRQLPRGDRTSIGSKGISLSGGQSQRIALARAVYARKEIIILDDTLSGLDSDTENRVFHSLLGRAGILRKQRTTVLLASSSIKRVPYADYTVVINNEGKVSEQGSFKDLAREGGYISSFNLPPPEWSYGTQPPKIYDSPKKPFGSVDENLVNAPLPPQSLEGSEDRRTGDFATYVYYVKAVGVIPTLLFVIAISAFVFCLSFPTIWVKWWAASNAEAPNQRLGYYLAAGSSSSDALFSGQANVALQAINNYHGTTIWRKVSLRFVANSLKFYLRTSRQLRLLDLEAKSPLYTQFMESLSGLATIRAFGWRNALEKHNSEMLDQSQKPFYLLFAVQRVAMLNVILFSQSIKMLLTFWTNLETHIGSIARVKTFTEKTIAEDLPEEHNTPPPRWPSRGGIEFHNMSAEYKPSEPVLRGISLSIQPGQKIGVCGRTGSGKSSLVLSIFRMIEMSAGRITIDDIDISTIPRQELRSRLVGVPQDSYLLSGSVRLNTDPLGLASDTEIINALKCVQIWNKVKENGGLGADIESIFLSHGQKQLFCLARAIIRPSRVLILDESTSR
ncbi:putative Metal resistance protein YCF1 [Glarea lozoyensis 74030]|uniref:Putative Metal resistance protein YCF1 n=1 Tax=Glarea lozoyensis (strain ATCC 74030 / MF5533) TaxID=1104152 RepID=H0EPF6_GLAL7|nr:putative Metal resistance protein YCF1 [Glarea lozoyensis 74030]